MTPLYENQTFVIEDLKYILKYNTSFCYFGQEEAVFGPNHKNGGSVPGDVKDMCKGKESWQHAK